MGNVVRANMAHSPLMQSLMPGQAANDLLGQGMGDLTKDQLAEELKRRRAKFGGSETMQPGPYGDQTVGGSTAAQSLLKMGLA